MDSVMEVLMIEVTTAATEQVAAFFRGRDVKPIRIFLNTGG
jgi:Fe-S cluster assembly iron-binding protein IscA